MVDGADKINNLNNNTYINKVDATRVAIDKKKQPVPLINKKHEYKFPFDVEYDNLPIEFEIPENAPQKAKEFIGSLIQNKEALMKELNIDSDTYDMLAHTAVGIAYAETNFGNTGDRIYKAFRELYVRYERFIKSYPNKPNHYSRGITNLKYTLHANDDNQISIRYKMINLGISDEYQLEDPSKSAIATIILLSNFNNKLDRNFYEGLEQSNEKYGTTRTDALCALWIGSKSKIAALTKGELKTSEWEYLNRVHSAMDQYKVKTK